MNAICVELRSERPPNCENTSAAIISQQRRTSPGSAPAKYVANKLPTCRCTRSICAGIKRNSIIGRTSVMSERFQLERHKMLHKNDLPCKICHKLFNERTIFHHMRRHTGESRVQCTDCGRFYANSESLKRHMVVHTGEAPFKCSDCGKCFRQSASLVVHRRSHTGQYIHYCQPCAKGFGARRELRRHNQRVHGIETQS